MSSSRVEDERLLRTRYASHGRPLRRAEDHGRHRPLDSASAPLVDVSASDSPDTVVEAFHGGRGKREIAARLRIPDGTVRSRMFYALREREVQQL